MAELVSILLATRNRATLLIQALQSIQRQAYRRIEILVFDDGSSDGTPEVLAQATKNEPRLRWFRHERSQGLAHALNCLIANSQGEYLARMDDDDWAHPNRIEHQLAYLKAHGLDVCGTWYRRRAGFRQSTMRPPTSHDAICAELLFQPPLLHPSVMLRREIIERFGAYSEDYPHAEDYELWIRLVPQCRFGNVPEVLMSYRLSATQVSRQYNPEQVRSAQRIRIAYLEKLGITCSEEEKALHASLRDSTPIEDVETLRAYKVWLEKLAAFFPKELTAVFARQWFLCAVRAAGLGLMSYATWSKSSLADDLPAQKRILLKGLCGMRLRYRSAPYRWLEPLANG